MSEKVDFKASKRLIERETPPKPAQTRRAHTKTNTKNTAASPVSVQSGRQVQVSVSLPPVEWERLKSLTQAVSELGESISQKQLLIGLLRVFSPDEPRAAAELVGRYNTADYENHSETRNIKLPLELREHLDEAIDPLRHLGRQYNRTILIAAVLDQAAPKNPAETAKAINNLREHDLQATLTAHETNQPK